ncbi:MAG: cobyrinate a,c-diamide synthase, partial [Candidatus Zixiibacteriota bacterium]
MTLSCPRLVIAGLSGDSGKTIASLSLVLALRQRGLRLSVFKKGPDYIDAAWLAWAAGSVCRNLDTYMVAAERVSASFAAAAGNSDLAIIEGNRGLFDGKDNEGTHSTANLAKLLRAPVVLVVNCTKTTRTVAAIVKGCQVFDADLRLAGIILNQVAGKRHRQVITDAIEQTCRIPVLGEIPRLSASDTLIPGRHLGLVTPAEFGESDSLAGQLRTLGERHLDLDRLLQIARNVEPLPAPDVSETAPSPSRVRIGYFRDPVYTFYYPENLEAIEHAGAELVTISSFADTHLPDIAGLYIGGGFPETQADKISKNQTLLRAVRSAINNGLPVYAECGGLIYLCRTLRSGCVIYPMADVFPVDLVMAGSPVGHGYTESTVDRPNPFFEIGAVLRGHEFHYSGPDRPLPEKVGCLVMQTGTGLGNGRDGLVY